MLNLFLFLLFFLFISLIFDYYCRIKNVNDSLYDESVKKTSLKTMGFILLLVLIPAFLVAMRSENTGVDTKRYLDLFLYGENYMWRRALESYEFLFWGGCIFFNKIGGERLAFFFFATLSLFIPLMTIYKLSKKVNVFVTTFLFLLLFYQECFNAMRQMPAIAIVFLSYTYIFERKIIPYTICILIASMFHSTALLALPIYLLYNYKLKSVTDYLKQIFLFVFLVFAVPTLYNSILQLPIMSRYSSYVMLYNADTLENSIKSFAICYLPSAVLLFFSSISQKKSRFNWNVLEFQFFWNVTSVFLMLIIFRIWSNYFFRIAFYYQLGVVLFAGWSGKTAIEFQNKPFYLKPISSIYLTVAFFIIYFVYLNYFHNLNSSALINFHIM